MRLSLTSRVACARHGLLSAAIIPKRDRLGKTMRALYWLTYAGVRKRHGLPRRIGYTCALLPIVRVQGCHGVPYL